MNPKYFFCVLCAISFNLFAFPCYLSVVKSSCWNDYNVSIDLIDVSNEKNITHVAIPQDKLWGRESFECSPRQTFRFEAQFNPDIWENDAQKKFKGKRYWSLPLSTDQAVAWNITICYPDDFSEVPTPRVAGKCGCDRSILPTLPIPDKKSS
jgi:hypothetical protein